MACYVDDMRAPYGRLILCHLLADSEAELESMARSLGLKPSWRHNDHYDICLSKRALALSLGAVPISLREACRIRIARRERERASRLAP